MSQDRDLQLVQRHTEPGATTPVLVPSDERTVSHALDQARASRDAFGPDSAGDITTTCYNSPPLPLNLQVGVPETRMDRPVYCTFPC